MTREKRQRSPQRNRRQSETKRLKTGENDSRKVDVTKERETRNRSKRKKRREKKVSTRQTRHAQGSLFQGFMLILYQLEFPALGCLLEVTLTLYMRTEI